MASLTHGGRTAGSGKQGGACPTVRGAVFSGRSVPTGPSPAQSSVASVVILPGALCIEAGVHGAPMQWKHHCIPAAKGCLRRNLVTGMFQGQFSSLGGWQGPAGPGWLRVGGAQRGSCESLGCAKVFVTWWKKAREGVSMIQAGCWRRHLLTWLSLKGLISVCEEEQ